MSKKLLYLTAVLLLLVAAATNTAVAKPPPKPATNPSPANSATDVSITADLSWSAGKHATSHDLYFGTTSPGASQGNQTATTFDTGTMDYDETYYWRIDEIGTGGTTTGSVWSFSTESEPDVPGQASSPSPGDDATGVSIYATLSWLAGSDATSHDVYFGTTSPGSSQGNQTSNIFDPPGIMDASTTYFWRIDEINALGTTTGVVWSFTTGGSGGETSTLITSIENSTQLADWSSNGTLSLSTDHVTNGSYCLKAVFGSVTPTLTYAPSSSFDVSGNVPAPATTNTNSDNIELLPRRPMTNPSQNVAGNNRKGSHSRSAAQKPAPANLVIPFL